MTPQNRARRHHLRVWLWVTAAVLLLSLLALVAAAVRFTRYAERADLEAARQAELETSVRQLRAVLLRLGEAETSQRGYLLTGQRDYLVPYTQAVAQMPALLQGLDRIPVAADKLAGRAQSVTRLVHLKFDEMAETLRLHDDGQRDAALRLVQTGTGRSFMDGARKELVSLLELVREDRDAASAELLRDNASARQSAVWTVAVMSGCVLLAALLLALLGRAQRRLVDDLSDSERRHRNLVEEQQELVSLAAADGRLLYVNPAYARHYHRSVEQMLGDNLFDHVAPGDLEAVRRHVQAVLDSGEPAHTENRIVTPDGSERWLAWTNTMQKDSAGRRQLHSVGRDITRRKHVEEALKASEAFLTRTGRLAGVGGWEVDLATSQVRWSEQVERTLEAPPGFVPQLDSVIAFFAPDVRPRIEEAVRLSREQGLGFDLELPLVTASGRSACVRSVGEVERDAQGQPVRLVGALQDITERKALETRLRELTDILEHTPDFIVQTDWKGRVQYMNPAARRSLGFGADEPLDAHSFTAFNTPQTNERYATEIMPAVKRDGVWVGETTVLRAGGEVLQVSHTVIAHRDADGRALRYSAVMRDISRQVADRQALRRQTATLGAVVEAIPAMVAVFDAELNYRLVNRAFERWRGLDRTVLTGHNVAEFMEPAEYASSEPWARRALAGETVQYEKDYTEAGHERHINVSYVPLRLDDGTVDGMIGVAQDITLHRQETRRLLNMAEHDPLTGVLNRAGFHQMLSKTCGNGEAAGLALLYIDLDRFKPVNDNHGHPVGDVLLQQFAQRLQGLVRPSDAVARLGGDEFAIVLSGLRSRGNADAVADKVVEAARAPFQVGELMLEIGASVGVAFDASDAHGWKGLVQRADAAVYQAKAAGRGRRV